MLKNLFLILSEFIVTFSVLVTSYCTTSPNFERELNLTKEYFRKNGAELIKEPQKNNSLSTVNETLFWALPVMKNATEMFAAEMDVHHIQGIQDVKSDIPESFRTEENVKEHAHSNIPAISTGESTGHRINYEGAPQKLNDSFQINEIILLRNNCHAEIAVHENRDMKLTLKFGNLQNNSYGRCCLTLSGHKNSMLGVLISNIHLYRNNTQGEVLKVIVGNRNTAFFLKEYYGSNDYEPLLLTETHKVYLILYYKVEYIAPNQDCTYFNIEVFTYRKHENNIHHCEEHKDNNHHIEASQVNHSHDFYSTEEMPYFTPYIYKRTDYH